MISFIVDAVVGVYQVYTIVMSVASVIVPVCAIVSWLREPPMTRIEEERLIYRS